MAENKQQVVGCAAFRCANNKGGECIALTECLMSDGRICPFYKSREDADAELAYCVERKIKKAMKNKA